MASSSGSEQSWGLAGLFEGIMSASTVCGLMNGIYVYGPWRGKPALKPPHAAMNRGTGGRREERTSFSVPIATEIPTQLQRE